MMVIEKKESVFKSPMKLFAIHFMLMTLGSSTSIFWQSRLVSPALIG